MLLFRLRDQYRCTPVFSTPLERNPLLGPDPRDPNDGAVFGRALHPHRGHGMRRAKRHQRRQKPGSGPLVHWPQYAITRQLVPLSDNRMWGFRSETPCEWLYFHVAFHLRHWWPGAACFWGIFATPLEFCPRPRVSQLLPSFLALGIGANTGMFSLADALLLRPLPVPAPDNVVTTSEAAPDIPIGTFGRVSYPDYVDLRNKSKTVEGLMAFDYTGVGLAEKPDALPQLKLALSVSGNFFQSMGVTPVLGRGFSPEEDRVPGRDAVAVLGYAAWQRNFAGDPKIVGRTIRLNNVAFTVIGVAPKKFTGIETMVHPDLYLPVMMLFSAA